MLTLSNQLLNEPIMSLQTGAELARTSGWIINPADLQIIALYVEGPQVLENPSVLHISDIREVSELGYIVDNSDVLMPIIDLVRLQEIIDLGIAIIGTPAIDERGTRLGKISDFAYEPSSFYIKQLYAHQSFMRSIGISSNVISREQIVAITKERIVVQSTHITDKVAQRASQASQHFVNPFKSPGQAEPNQIERD